MSLFGTVFAAPFRTYFLLRERLRFPGGYATGILIGVLHHDESIAYMADMNNQNSLIDDEPPASNQVLENVLTDDRPIDDSSDNLTTVDEFEWASKVMIIVKAFSGTTIYVNLSH